MSGLQAIDITKEEEKERKKKSRFQEHRLTDRQMNEQKDKGKTVYPPPTPHTQSLRGAGV
jgi:hypothetical protein